MKKAENQRDDIVDWFIQNQRGQVDCLFIPKNQSNAFMGVVVGQTNPSVALLDYDKVLTNLIKDGMGVLEAQNFVALKIAKKAPYEPFFCHRFPDLHPNTFNKS